MPEGVWSVFVAEKSNGVVRKNAGASLIDLGDGVGCISFHSKMNAIGGDIVQLITETLRPGSKVGANFDAFVITNDAANFSVGANIMLLLMSIQEQEWDEIDFMIRGFQGMTQTIKFSPKPVVVAPFGMALGGGCEVALHARGAPASCRALHGLGGGRRGPASGRRRLQGDDAARRGCGECDPQGRARRVGGDHGGHEADVRDSCHGQGIDVGE